MTKEELTKIMTKHNFTVKNLSEIMMIDRRMVYYYLCGKNEIPSNRQKLLEMYLKEEAK